MDPQLPAAVNGSTMVTYPDRPNSRADTKHASGDADARMVTRAAAGYSDN